MKANGDSEQIGMTCKSAEWFLLLNLEANRGPFELPAPYKVHKYRCKKWFIGSVTNKIAKRLRRLKRTYVVECIGQVVSTLVFYSDDSSSNPTYAESFRVIATL